MLLLLLQDGDAAGAAVQVPGDVEAPAPSAPQISPNETPAAGGGAVAAAGHAQQPTSSAPHQASLPCSPSVARARLSRCVMPEQHALDT